MGVKALQKRLSATVFMKAGISEPALIGFNAVLPACLSRNEIPRGLWGTSYPDRSVKSRRSWWPLRKSISLQL